MYRYRHVLIGTLVIAGISLGSFAYHAMSDVRDISSAVAVCDKGADKRACFTDIVMSAAKKDGIAAGLDTLAEVYAKEPGFAEYCHSITHDIGALAYESFKAHSDFSLSANTSSCGFGFYHGFMEALLANTGDLSEAKRFCEYVDLQMKKNASNVSAACYHGIGHGVVDGADESRWGDPDRFIQKGLDLCAALGKIDDNTEHLTRCASGVFNSLAIAYMDPKYRLSSNPEDPYAICKGQSVVYVRKACYDQMNGYVANSHARFADALKTILKSAEPAYLAVAIGSVSAVEASIHLAPRRSGGTIVHSAELSECGILDANLRVICAKGFGDGLVEAGDPASGYTDAIAICGNGGALASECFGGVAQAAKDWAPEQKQKSVCDGIRAIDRSSGAACDDLMRSSQAHP